MRELIDTSIISAVSPLSEVMTDTGTNDTSTLLSTKRMKRDKSGPIKRWKSMAAFINGTGRLDLKRIIMV